MGEENHRHCFFLILFFKRKQKGECFCSGVAIVEEKSLVLQSNWFDLFHAEVFTDTRQLANFLIDPLCKSSIMKPDDEETIFQLLKQRERRVKFVK